MFRVGLTGGIASGKSTVAQLFAERGAAVIDSDRIAREVVAPGTRTLARLASAVGSGIVDSAGRLDRKALRHRVFEDAATRAIVESILHPAILEELERQSARAAGPYHVLVIPLLVEGGHERLVDRVLVVDCPEELQIARLMSRDGETRESALRMLDAQASRERRLAAAHDVIVNDRGPRELAPQVAELDRKYREMARQR